MVEFENVDMDGETLNATNLPFGFGVVAFTSYDGAALIYSGEVVQRDVEIPLIKDGFTLTGNVSPVDLLLGALSANENFAPFEDSIQIFDSNGSLVTEVTYVSQEMLDENEMTGVEAGWWRLTDVDMEQGTLNSMPVMAGQALTAFTSYEGASIIVPNPIKD